MKMSTQSVEQTVFAMEKVLTKYLSDEEINNLTTEWKNYPLISAKTMQQCVLETTKRYPELVYYKSEIRKGFYKTIQRLYSRATANCEQSPDFIIESKPFSEEIEAFYTIMETLAKQLNAPNQHYLFFTMHQNILKERTFEEHVINIEQFSEGNRPALPDDVFILNNLVQLSYVCLCDLLGPVEADNILFNVAETAKRLHAKAVVNSLF